MTDQDDAIDASLNERPHLSRFEFGIVAAVRHQERVAVALETTLQRLDPSREDGRAEGRDHRAHGMAAARCERAGCTIPEIAQLFQRLLHPCANLGADLFR